MAFCNNCGTQLPENVASCPNCSHSIVAEAGNIPTQTGGATGLDENVAGLLCYAGAWVTGLIFFLIDKRPFVRFHAAQSMVVFGGLQLIYVILFDLLFHGALVGVWELFSLLLYAVKLAATVLWIVLMVKAYQHEQFRVPVAAEIADSIFKK